MTDGDDRHSSLQRYTVQRYTETQVASPRARNADWLWHLVESANSGTVVFSMSYIVKAMSEAKSQVKAPLNDVENSYANEERKEHLSSDSALKIAAYLGSL